MGEKEAQGTRKGQYFSFDAMVAVIIFVLAVSLLTSYWFGVRAIMDAQSDDIAKDALRLSDSLIGPGNPIDWAIRIWPSSAGPTQFGLCTDYSSDVLDEQKLEKFQQRGDSDYEGLKTGLRIGNDFYVNITDPLGEYGYDAGWAPPAGIKNVVIVRRVVALNASDGMGGHAQRPMSLNIYLWNNRTVS